MFWFKRKLFYLHEHLLVVYVFMSDIIRRFIDINLSTQSMYIYFITRVINSLREQTLTIY